MGHATYPRSGAAMASSLVRTMSPPAPSLSQKEWLSLEPKKVAPGGARLMSAAPVLEEQVPDISSPA